MTRQLGLLLRPGDGSDGMDAPAWKSIALHVLARSGEGLVVCHPDLSVFYCSPRAARLLARMEDDPQVEAATGHVGSALVLPRAIAAAVNEQLACDDPSRTDRVRPASGGNAIEVSVSRLRGGCADYVAVYLREELLRDDDLYALLKERFGVSLRGVQLAQLVRQGLTNREIAARLRLTESTVKGYLHRLYRACGVSSRTGLIALLDRLS